jgi:hypothetical protein
MNEPGGAVMRERGFRGFLTVLVIVGGAATVQAQVPNLAALEGCWEAKNVTKATVLKWTCEIPGETTSGQCDVDVVESWFLCLTEGNGLTIGGTASIRQQRNFKKNPDIQLSRICSCLAVSSGYYQQFAADGKVSGGQLHLTLKPQGCLGGICPKRNREVVVVQRKNAVVMILEDQTEIVLEKKIG